MPETYSDDDFLDAVDGVTGTHAVAAEVGCAEQTAHRRLYDLALEGEIGFMQAPDRRESNADAIIASGDMVEKGLHVPPEDWPTLRDK